MSKLDSRDGVCTGLVVMLLLTALTIGCCQPDRESKRIDRLEEKLRDLEAANYKDLQKAGSQIHQLELEDIRIKGRIDSTERDMAREKRSLESTQTKMNDHEIRIYRQEIRSK